MKKLELMANKLRVHSIISTDASGSGHPTSCMSCAEIMSCLFFSVMQKEDEFILSKGHAAPILWACYAEAGIFPAKELLNLRKIDSPLEGHPTANMPMIKVATGSLGQGLSAGVGMALGKRLHNKARPGKVFVLIGDGESAEGSVWEAANSAAHYKLNNLTAIIDVNRLGQSQETMHGHKVKIYKKKFEAFGWKAIVVDGHNVNSLLKALRMRSKKPKVIIAKTFKGKGYSFVENKNGFHGKPIQKERLHEALREIGQANVSMRSNIGFTPIKYKVANFKPNKYELGEKVATRVAFGDALVKLGKNPSVVAIDGDVRNSCMTIEFFKAYPERSFESYIAEQDMLGMAIGLSALGFVPFVATFAAFLTRAHDFIRMAQYSKANIKIIGTHAGVSIGEDGPSQMGMEDISMFLSMQDSVILYPCDAVSTEQLVGEMEKHQGISYLRATRGKTPVIYKNSEKFRIGGLKVLKKSSKDKVLVIAAGITVFEALKAHDELKKKRKNIRVIDLYSIKPIDEKSLIKNVKACKGDVIIVEDHFDGGIGGVVAKVLAENNIQCKFKHLYVKDLPRSGKPGQLLKKYKIDSSAIVKAVKQR